jgi:hypothetical protein
MYSYSSNIITEKVKVETLCLGKHIGILKGLMTNGNKHMFLAMFLGNAWRHDFSTHARALSLSNKQPPLCLSLPPKSMPSSSSSVPSEVHFFPALGSGPVAPCYSRRFLLRVLDADAAALHLVIEQLLLSPHVLLLVPGSGRRLRLRVPTEVVRGHTTTLAVAVAILVLQSLLATTVPHQVGHGCQRRRASGVLGVLDLCFKCFI